MGSAEQALSTEALLRQFLKYTPAAVAMFDIDLRYLQVSDRWLADYQLEAADIIGRSHYEVFPEIPERWKAVHARVLAGAIERADDDPFPRADGRTDWLQWEVRPWYGPTGAIGGLIMFTQVVTERKRFEAELRLSEERLRESEARLRQVTDNLHQVVWMTTLDRETFLYVSNAYEQIWGRTCASLYADSRSWRASIHPDDRARVDEAVDTNDTEAEKHLEYRIVRPDGVRWIHTRWFLIRDADGALHRIGGVSDDITDRKRVEEQFRQAQKMEAIGQLAGGVAHDFNNILSAIMLQVDEVASYLPSHSIAHEPLAEISGASERAANLTRQLLQFSRKQVMQARWIDLNENVSGLAKLLKRVIPELIEMRFVLEPTPQFTFADSGMVDQVLMNLTVNARDAMPDGGRLTIETRSRTITEDDARTNLDAVPGSYVSLCVHDDGCGIADEHISRIFEPFFTTKEPGRGTGLGLATVFGIVKQHSGWVSVTSVPGRGTTFEVLLPAATTVPVGVARPSRPSGSFAGDETILLVEDDPQLRRMLGILFTRHGYRVLEARSGSDAMRIWTEHASRVDLLITDLVMPDGGGLALASRLQADQPALHVILTSGYSPELAGRTLELRARQSFVAKPCPPQQLLVAVRECLDS